MAVWTLSGQAKPKKKTAKAIKILYVLALFVRTAIEEKGICFMKIKLFVTLANGINNTKMENQNQHPAI